MLKLYFSTKGRLKRFSFFTLSITPSIITLSAVFVAALIAGTGVTLEDAFKLFSYMSSLTVLLIGLFLLGAWVQICLVFKRNRDFSDTTTFAKIYVGVLLAPLVFIYFGPIGMIVALFFSVITFIMTLILWLKNSKVGQIYTDFERLINKPLFGNRSVFDNRSVFGPR